MIDVLRRLSPRSRHARPEVLSRYLDGELERKECLTVEAHLRGCSDCRTLLESLRSAVEGLRSMRGTATNAIADSVIAALRKESPSQDAMQVLSSSSPRPPMLTVVPDRIADTVEPTNPGPPASSRRGPILRAVLAYCLRRPQLRLTLPLGLVVGIALSLINKGYMIFSGNVDVEMCAVCALDFVIPFVALNVGLVLATRIAGRRRFRA
jgi:anti-sigma factor RsiW